MKYSDIDKEELIKGVKIWQNPVNKLWVVMVHYTADIEKDPDRDGKEWYERESAGMTKAQWNKEYEIDFTTKSGKLIYGPEYCDFKQETHLINSFKLGDTEKILAMDFGQRNPNCALIGQLAMDGTLYITDEYYKPAIPSVASREMYHKFGYLMPGYKKSATLDERRYIVDDAFQIKVIDPTTAHKNRTKVIDGEEIPYSVIEDFYDNGFDFDRATNDIDAGITRVREYFGINKNGKSRLYIFQDKCPNLCRELLNYRYQENTEKVNRKNNEPEKPIKKNDHGPDTLRYLIMTRPNKPEEIEKPLTRIQKDINNLLRPKIYNDFDVD